MNNKFQKADLVKVDVAINGLVVDSLSAIMHKSEAQRKGRDIAQRLRNVIPRQMFEIPIQIMLGSKIIARESVKAFRKNVTAKLYGGDVTRKKKLLEKPLLLTLQKDLMQYFFYFLATLEPKQSICILYI